MIAMKTKMSSAVKKRKKKGEGFSWKDGNWLIRHGQRLIAAIVGHHYKAI